ncbi:hypothetical protein [Kordiimonas pumila]|uniref:Uncharacterized protein n=1 Tax=Kordiimonas pumila TaxID=2161677 RepID=A0ABV7D551_9PROT|nr:hypothetical protein [Kordiimonas pumila]
MRCLNFAVGLSVLILLPFQTGLAFFAESPEKMKSHVTPAVIANVRTLLEKPIIQLSVAKQNERLGSISEKEILKLDNQWRSEREANDQPLIAPTLNNPLSTYLTQIQAGSGGLYTEIFIMDNKGLNVGQSSITSDFWQGDEAKFQKTYPEGPNAIFIDEPEFHEATKTWRVQLNMTINTANGTPIGAATFELNLTELARRAQ